jgi:hypothetical protein
VRAKEELTHQLISFMFKQNDPKIFSF